MTKEERNASIDELIVFGSFIKGKSPHHDVDLLLVPHENE